MFFFTLKLFEKFSPSSSSILTPMVNLLNFHRLLNNKQNALVATLAMVFPFVSRCSLCLIICFLTIIFAFCFKTKNYHGQSHHHHHHHRHYFTPLFVFGCLHTNVQLKTTVKITKMQMRIYRNGNHLPGWKPIYRNIFCLSFQGSYASMSFSRCPCVFVRVCVAFNTVHRI